MLTYFVSIYFRALKNDTKLKNTVRGKLLTCVSCSLEHICCKNNLAVLWYKSCFDFTVLTVEVCWFILFPSDTDRV